MSLFALGTIDPLLVSDFSGFDRPGSVQLVRVLSDGSSTDNEVLQRGGLPLYQASVSGLVQSAADVAAFRGWYDSAELVNFRDGNGNVTSCRVIALTIVDRVAYWTFGATLVAASPAFALPGSS